MLSATGTFVMKAIVYLLGTVVVLAGILYGGTVARWQECFKLGLLSSGS